MASSLDSQIDSLYKLPADEFTAARNALAKTAGARADEVRKLQKPKAAAWAVNQIYWNDRALFDRLAKAAVALRRAHVEKIGGKAVDIAALEGRHRAAVEEARRRAAAFLESSGSASPPTLASIERTLLAVPSAEIAGRLTDQVDSVGFGLLSGLLDSSAGHARGMADVVSISRPSTKDGHAGTKTGKATAAATSTKATHAAEARQARVEAAARQRERVRLERALKEAEADERAAKAAFTKSRQAVEQADARIERLEGELRQARASADERRADVDRRRVEANDAAATRVQRERALRLLGD